MHWIKTEDNEIINLEHVRKFYIIESDTKSCYIFCSMTPSCSSVLNEFPIKFFEKKVDAIEWLNKLWIKLYDTHQYDPTATEV